MIIKHFTATTYVLNKNMDQMILLWHPKLHSWMPPGGHIEENESHELAAIREIKEELGIQDGWFLQPENYDFSVIDSRARPMLIPNMILEEKITENHFHLDLIFLAVTEHKEVKSPEGHELKWFTPTELENETALFTNVKKLAMEAFTIQNFKMVEFSFFESSSSM